MTLRVVVFDFDLTLADSTDGVTECVNFALARLGLPARSAESIRRTIGLPLSETFRALSPVTDTRLEHDFVQCFVQRADEVMAELTDIFPEVPDTLDAPRSMSTAPAIVSAKFAYRIRDILARAALDTQFSVIVGGEDVSPNRPATTMTPPTYSYSRPQSGLTDSSQC